MCTVYQRETTTLQLRRQMHGPSSVLCFECGETIWLPFAPGHGARLGVDLLFCPIVIENSL